MTDMSLASQLERMADNGERIAAALENVVSALRRMEVVPPAPVKPNGWRWPSMIFGGGGLYR
jgi:hypothetical protein